MVNEADTIASPADVREAERALALGYAPADRRAALAALFALDERLGDILRSTREPLVGQMRLTWWHEALTALDRREAPAEPVLTALAREVTRAGVPGADLAGLVDGWEALLDMDVPDDPALERYAAGRGGRLFALAARLLGAGDARVEAVGEGWALADLAQNLSDAPAAGRTAAMARDRLGLIGGGWMRALRPLAALGLLARSDLAGGAAGSPRRVARLMAMRLTGR
ncbi:squalene/phytoene synthase family protein [Sphingomonas rubra]|uniref:Phytoene synthase n=1 Tax=Sphingomonas rubra TaxID=634430 RepID=A0A1I5T8D8_9SPHN|nr:squalene/phytoene synthase family protein [Sphingomonas rubra]SFP79208.1 phytoene synthase [Sphingomonas rubra]